MVTRIVTSQSARILVPKTRQYEQGKRAFFDHAELDDCPYKVGDIRRCIWMDGYLDARTLCRLGHIFAKYRLEYP